MWSNAATCSLALKAEVDEIKALQQRSPCLIAQEENNEQMENCVQHTVTDPIDVDVDRLDVRKME